jgi:hypothetical protein
VDTCGMGGPGMTDAIFLSAGVPDPKRGPQYAKTADTVAITAAVSESWARESGQVGKWIFCLTTARLAEDQEIR